MTAEARPTPSLGDDSQRGRPTLARLGGNVGWLVFERVFQLGTAFLVSVWFVRYAGPSAYGTYAYALSLATLFGTLGTFGTDAVVVRELARSPDSAGDVLGGAIAIRAATGLAAWLAAIASIYLVRDDALSRALVTIMGAGAIALGLGVFDLWFQARLEARPASLGRMLVSTATIVARVALLVVRAPLVAFAWAQFLSTVANALVVWALYRRRARAPIPLVVRLERVRAILAESWPLFVAGLAVMVYMKIDQVMLGQMVGDRANGIYATAATLSEVWYFIPVSIGTTALPLIARSDARLAETLQALYDAMVAISYAIAIPVTLAAGLLVTGLFGPAYAEAAAILRVHVWSLPFVALGTARSRYLVAQGLTRFAMVATVCGAIVNVGLNLVLIPRYAGLGAAWATLVSYAVAGWVTGAFHPRVREQFRMASAALVVPFRPSMLISRLRRRHGAVAG